MSDIPRLRELIADMDTLPDNLDPPTALIASTDPRLLRSSINTAFIVSAIAELKSQAGNPTEAEAEYDRVLEMPSPLSTR